MKLTNIIPFKVDLFIALLLLVAPGYLYAENCPDNAISYWKLDETNPSSFEDSIGNHNGDCSATTCPSNDNGGAVNSAKDFVDDSDGIDVPAAADFDWSSADSFSVEMWVKRDSADLDPNGEVLIGRIDPDTSLEWRVEIRSIAGGAHAAAFKLVDTEGTGAGESLVTVGSKPISLNDWHHIVAIRDADSNTNILYVDGQFDGQQQNLQYSAGFDSATANLNIGWIDGDTARPLNGLIDEVAVYNRALTEQEIRSHYFLSRGYCSELESEIGIMPMGNSITHDRIARPDPRNPAERVGYRKTLYDNLRDNNYWIDFKGSQSNDDGQEFDVFAGWGGMRASHILDVLDDGIFQSPDPETGEVDLGTNGPYLNAYPTDMILLHIGTNDVGSEINNPTGLGDFPNQPIAEINSILDRIDEFDERTTVLLARIISRSDDPDPSVISSFNGALQTMADERIDNGDKIIVVDMETAAGLIYPTDLRDGIHPTTAGYGKMGNYWYQILNESLSPFVAANITSSPIEEAVRDQLYTYPVISEGTGTLTYDFVGTPPQGMTVTAQGVIEWTPTADDTVEVTVRVTNPMPFNQTASDEQTFEIVVADNATPVGVNDTYPVTKGTTLNRDAAQGVLANDTDADGDTLTAAVLQSPAHGTLTLNPDGSFAYAHDDGDSTSDTFTYAVSDGKSQSTAVTVTLNITDPNTPDSGGGGGGGCFISAAGISDSHGRQMMMIGALAALGILVMVIPAVVQGRRNSTFFKYIHRGGEASISLKLFTRNPIRNWFERTLKPKEI